ncbi:MAG: hypothetical protein AAGC74_08195 [Verrucomicrobiota bacterium]
MRELLLVSAIFFVGCASEETILVESRASEEVPEARVIPGPGPDRRQVDENTWRFDGNEDLGLVEAAKAREQWRRDNGFLREDGSLNRDAFGGASVSVSRYPGYGYCPRYY